MPAAAYRLNVPETARVRVRYGDWALGVLGCAALWWRRATPNSIAPNEDRATEPLTGAGAPPALIVGGRVDNVSPYHWAEHMVETMDNSVLLTREGVGHTSYRQGTLCIDTAVDATLIDGVMPAEGTVCAVPPATTEPAGTNR